MQQRLLHRQGVGVPLPTGRQARVPCHPRGTGPAGLPAGPPAHHPRPFVHSCTEHRRQADTDTPLTAVPSRGELAFMRDEKEGNGQGSAVSEHRAGTGTGGGEEGLSFTGAPGRPLPWRAGSPSREGKGSRQWLEAAAGRPHRRAARARTGSEPRAVVLATRQVTPGTGLSAPGEVRDTRPGLARSH